jgi:hypothetical protein
MASMPAAHPTANTPDQEEAAKPERNCPATADSSGNGRRLPESPTKGKLETMETGINITI